MSKKTYEFSIIIVTYNGKKYVDKCVDSIYDSDITNFEIIVVDNGSTDGTVEYLQEKHKERKNFNIVGLDDNYGPSRARNEGFKIAKGKYIGFLDNDTEVHKDWANFAKKEFDADPKLGIIQCKLLLAKERKKIDYVGEYIGQNGFLVQRAATGELDAGQYDEKVDILAAKSAGMFICSKVLRKIGGFDGDYFIYVEETDLGWRSWLAGYEAKFIPKSIVYHEFGTSNVILGRAKNNYNAKFHGTKNYILTHLKNLEGGSILKIVPVHIFLWMGLALYSIFKGQWKSGWWIIKGILWNVVFLDETLKKREKIQGSRKVSDEYLFEIFMKKMPFKYFLSKATSSYKIGNAESFSKMNERKQK